MEGTYSDSYSFIGEWYDNTANLIKQYNVFYFPFDDTIAMYDLKTKKPFVRRSKIEGVTLDNFFIGCTVFIFSRIIKIIDFGCENTRKKLQQQLQVQFVLIKPLPIATCGKILKILFDGGLRVTKLKLCRITTDDLNMLYRSFINEPGFPFVSEYINNKMCIALEVVGKDAPALCAKIVGNRDPTLAEPGTIRALFGQTKVYNCVHMSVSGSQSVMDTDYFFNSPHVQLTPTLSNCTLCIVKPHAIREGKLGTAIQMIDENGFEITAMFMLTVEHVNSCEFLEVYKGIVPEYKGMVDELSSGQCVAMEIVCKDKTKNSAVEFRKFAGPSDPEIARLLRPHTLRANLGVSKIKNAIHCSDLPEDGLLEVEYFFKILEMNS